MTQSELIQVALTQTGMMFDALGEMLREVHRGNYHMACLSQARAEVKASNALDMHRHIENQRKV